MQRKLKRPRSKKCRIQKKFSKRMRGLVPDAIAYANSMFDRRIGLVGMIRSQKEPTPECISKFNRTSDCIER